MHDKVLTELYLLTGHGIDDFDAMSMIWYNAEVDRLMDRQC